MTVEGRRSLEKLLYELKQRIEGHEYHSDFQTPLGEEPTIGDYRMWITWIQAALQHG